MASRRNNRRIPQIVELLEGRRLLSTSVWTGVGTNTNFSTAANWQGNVAPASGDDVVFNDLGSAQTVNFDSSETVDNMYISGNYTFTGSTLFLDGNIETEPSASATFSLSVTPNANNHFTTDAGSTLTFSGFQSGYSQTFDKYGDGTMVLNGILDANVQLLAGTLTDNGYNMDLTQYAGVLNSTSGTDAGRLDSLVSAGGVVQVSPGNSLTVRNGVTFSGGKLEDQIASATSYGQIVLEPPFFSSTPSAVSFGNGSTLQLDVPGNFSVATGSAIVVFDGSGPSATLSGTFTNLAEGATITAGSEQFTGSYLNHDLTLTALAHSPAITLTASKTRPEVGESVTLTATLAGSTPTPTGTITFNDNGVSLGTGILVNGVATLIVPSFAAGSHPITASYSGDSTFASGASSTLAVNSVLGLRFTTPATATLKNSSVATLSATGADLSASLTKGLTYTWSLLSKPTGASDAVFGINGTHAAATTTATFSKDGRYRFRVTIKDKNGRTATSDVDYVAFQKAQAIRLSPHLFNIKTKSSQQISAVVVDQFGHAIRGGTASFTVLTTNGTISSTGLFTASALGRVDIEVDLGGLTGTLSGRVS